MYYLKFSKEILAKIKEYDLIEMNKTEELRCDIYIICEIGGVLGDVILYCRGERYEYKWKE